MITFAAAFAGNMIAGASARQSPPAAVPATSATISPEDLNGAVLPSLSSRSRSTTADADAELNVLDPAAIRLQGAAGPLGRLVYGIRGTPEPDLIARMAASG